MVSTETIMDKTPEEPKETAAAAEEPEEELLYHYTTQAGLLGILADKNIRATHLRYLNDTSEGQIVSKALSHEIIDRFDADDFLKYLDLTPATSDEKIKCSDEEIRNTAISSISWATSQDVFVTSFSEQKDLLSQWRGYAASYGYSIGFSKKYLRTVAKHFFESLDSRSGNDQDPLVQCKYYDEKEKESLDLDIESAVSNYLTEAMSLNESMPQTNITESMNLALTRRNLSNQYFSNFGRRSAVTKDHSFHQEAEWRFIFTTNRFQIPPEIKFRSGLSMVTPYLEIPLTWEDQQMEIKKIVVGPCPDPIASQRAIEMLLKSKGFLDIKGNRPVSIVLSKIPYRNW